MREPLEAVRSETETAEIKVLQICEVSKMRWNCSGKIGVGEIEIRQMCEGADGVGDGSQTGEFGGA